MHQVPLARRSAHVLDPEAVCAAAGSLDDGSRVRALAALLAAAGDPTRLALLQCLHVSGQMCVTDLAVASGVERTAVSHALRQLRAAGAVDAERGGRLARYRLASPLVSDLLDLLARHAPVPRHDHHGAEDEALVAVS